MSSSSIDEFALLKEYPPTEEFIHNVAKKVRLRREDAREWLDHLHTVLLNRRRGAKKAAAKRGKAASARMPERTTIRDRQTSGTSSAAASDRQTSGTSSAVASD